MTSVSVQEGLAACQAGDHPTALLHFRALAEQGNPEAQWGLGSMYAEGQGVEQDHSQAITWFRRAAEGGHVLSQRNMGVMYFGGKGVGKSYAEAGKWYEHPDRWLLPLRPQRPEDAWRILARRKQPNPKIAKEVARTAELQARIEQTRVDRERYKERHAWVLSPESPSDLTIPPVDWDQRLAALLRSM